MNDDVTLYEKPFPDPDSIAPLDEKFCPATKSGFGCTREPGHAGDHQATGMGSKMLAAWPGDPL